jgi:hypothetical protein
MWIAKIIIREMENDFSHIPEVIQEVI